MDARNNYIDCRTNNYCSYPLPLIIYPFLIQMAFNASPQLQDKEAPIDLWAGMKDLAKDVSPY